MSKLLEIKDVWQGASLSIADDCWQRRHHPANREDQQQQPTVVIVRRGSYRRRFRQQQVIGTPNHVTFYNPGEPYQVDHIRGQQTKVTAIKISFDLLETLLVGRDPGAAKRNRFPEHLTHILCPPGWYRLHKQLLAYLSTAESSQGQCDTLMVEEILLSLLDTIVDQGCGTKGGSLDINSASSINQARVAAAQEVMADRFGESLSMKDVASAVGCSPWHLARQFAEQVGIPLHRFLNRLRLRNALERLCDGEEDLGKLADESGFCSHSHFSSAFKREFAITPRQARTADHASYLQEVMLRLHDPRFSQDSLYSQ
ncbi:MAG: helix-turn-helix transcriptional regulator [Planctomycetota bacterium]|jgi:AraC-like DNA-binding protein